MPTYSNVSTRHKSLVNMNGEFYLLAPGEQGESLQFRTDPDLQLLTREPLFQKTIETAVTVGTTPYVDLNPAFDSIFVYKISNTVTVLAESDTVGQRIELLKEQTSDNPVVVLKLDGVYDRLIFTGNGTCALVQSKTVPVGTL